MPRSKQFTEKEMKERRRAQKTASALRIRREAQGRDPLAPSNEYRKGEYNPRAALTWKIVRYARKKWANGEGGYTVRGLLAHVEERFEITISYGAFYDALRGKTWIDQ